MRTFRKTTDKPNYLFGLLPYYFKANDTYKDVNDEGLLERFLELFCEEIDTQVSYPIDSILYIFDALSYDLLAVNNPNDFLNYLAENFNNPPDIGTEDQYKILLRYLAHILRVRGTRKGIELFLAIFGYRIKSLNEYSLDLNIYDNTPNPSKYDQSLQYDNEFIFYSEFDLIIEDYPGYGTNPPTAAWLALLKEAIEKFLIPIWARLVVLSYDKGLIYGLIYGYSDGTSSVTGTLSSAEFTNLDFEDGPTLITLGMMDDGNLHLYYTDTEEIIRTWESL